MKKIISLIMSLIMVICILASCADSKTDATSNTTVATTAATTGVKISPESYSASEYLDGELSFYLEHLHTDEAGNLEKTEEYADYTDEAKVGTVKKIEIDGKTYDFTYSKSRNTDKYNYTRIDFYVCENVNQGDRVTAEFNVSLGKITALYSIDREVDAGTKITRDAALEKAMEVLAKETAFASEYEVTYENERSNDTYYFRLNRVVNDVKTYESALISIDFNGGLNSYKFISTGAFDGIDASGIDMSAVDAAIKEKADKIYEGYSYEITERDFTLKRKADGSFAFDVALKADVSGKELENAVQDRMNMFIYLG